MGKENFHVKLEEKRQEEEFTTKRKGLKVIIKRKLYNKANLKKKININESL